MRIRTGLARDNHAKSSIDSEELARLRTAFCTAIAWIAQSSTGVLSISDAEKLIRMAEHGIEPSQL